MKNKKVYIRLIWGYLAVFMIPLIMNVVMLEDIGNSTQENICKNVLMNLNHTKETIDNNFEEIDSIVEKLSANSTVFYIATQMDERDKLIEISKILSVQDYMSVMTIQSFVEEYYLIFHYSDMVISPEHVYLFHDSMSYDFKYGDMEWDAWKEMMRENHTKYYFPEAMTRQNRQSSKALLYVQSLVTTYGTKGTFVFPIRSEYIKSLLADAYVSEDGWAYVLDENGKKILTITSENEEFELIPQEYLENNKSIQEIRLNGRWLDVITTSSEENGLTYVAVLPKDYITTQVSEAQQKSILLIVFALFVGLLAICVVSWYRGRKIDQMLQVLFRIKPDDARKQTVDAITYISDSLSQLVENNADLQEHIKKQQPITRGLLVERLLRGTGAGSDRNLEEYGIRLKDSKMIVLAFVFEEGHITMEEDVSTDETVALKQVLSNALNRVLPGEKYMCDTDINEGAILCAMDREAPYDKNALQGQIGELIEYFWEEYGVAVKIAIGNMCEKTGQISKAYDQVCEMLQYGAESDKNVFFYEDYMENRDYYYFPVPLEERLVNAVRTGDMDNMHDQLKEVYQINVMERNISPSMMHFLVNDLQCAVFKALHNLEPHVKVDEEEIYKQLEQINRENDILLRFNRINNIFHYICKQVQEQTVESTDRQKMEIENYIRSNFGNRDLGLTKIADDFGYSSTYFSKLFKELFGENFGSYLEKVRIEQVCSLLKGSDTMEAIAEKTGYNSVYVMRTAFKRIKGMTPNDFRKNNS